MSWVGSKSGDKITKSGFGWRIVRAHPKGDKEAWGHTIEKAYKRMVELLTVWPKAGISK